MFPSSFLSRIKVKNDGINCIQTEIASTAYSNKQNQVEQINNKSSSGKSRDLDQNRLHTGNKDIKDVIMRTPSPTPNQQNSSSCMSGIDKKLVNKANPYSLFFGIGQNFCPNSIVASRDGLDDIYNDPQNTPLDFNFGKKLVCNNKRDHLQSTPKQDGLHVCQTESPALRMMSKMGWKEGTGLGRNQQGITEPINPKSQLTKRGLGLAKPVVPPKKKQIKQPNIACQKEYNNDSSSQSQDLPLRDILLYDYSEISETCPMKKAELLLADTEDFNNVTFDKCRDGAKVRIEYSGSVLGCAEDECLGINTAYGRAAVEAVSLLRQHCYTLSSRSNTCFTEHAFVVSRPSLIQNFLTAIPGSYINEHMCVDQALCIGIQKYASSGMTDDLVIMPGFTKKEERLINTVSRNEMLCVCAVGEPGRTMFVIMKPGVLKCKHDHRNFAPELRKHIQNGGRFSICTYTIVPPEMKDRLPLDADSLDVPSQGDVGRNGVFYSSLSTVDIYNSTLPGDIVSHANLGLDSSNEGHVTVPFVDAVKAVIDAYVTSASKENKVFSKDFNRYQRVVIHQLARESDIHTKSYGYEDEKEGIQDRYLVLNHEPNPDLTTKKLRKARKEARDVDNDQHTITREKLGISSAPRLSESSRNAIRTVIQHYANGDEYDDLYFSSNFSCYERVAIFEAAGEFELGCDCFGFYKYTVISRGDPVPFNYNYYRR